MARIHGKRGMFYMALTYGALPSPVAYLSDWTISFSLSFNETTAYGDPSKLYTAQTPEVTGDFSGFYDDSSRQFYLAARDGLPRGFYLYPDLTDDPNQGWTGLMLPDFAVSGGAGGAVTVKSTWKSAGGIFQSLSLGGRVSNLNGVGTCTCVPIIKAVGQAPSSGVSLTVPLPTLSETAKVIGAGVASCTFFVSGLGGLQDEAAVTLFDEGGAQILDEG